MQQVNFTQFKFMRYMHKMKSNAVYKVIYIRPVEESIVTNKVDFAM